MITYWRIEMKKLLITTMACLLLFTLSSCIADTSTATTISKEEGFDNYSYSSLTFPNYSTNNPIRYLDEDERGNYNGWQDFGSKGEVLTHPWPWTTYTYQMYSYYIRNNLQQLYVNVFLPEKLEDLPIWLTKTKQDGHRIIWYSIGLRLPDEITLIKTETLTSINEIQTFLKAEYKVRLEEKEEDWIIYFLEVDGIYSSYAVNVNESYETVTSVTTSIVRSYQEKNQ
jgi:hypothetical protein